MDANFKTGAGVIVIAAVAALGLVGWRLGVAVAALSSDDCMIEIVIEDGVERGRTERCT